MSVAREAKLILSLQDRVTGPARAIQASLTGLNQAVATAGAVAMAPARSMASGMVALGIGKAAQTAYEWTDILNEIEGRRFGKRDIFNLADGTEMSREAFRQSVRDLVATIDKESPRNASEIAQAYAQLVQAGLSHEQVEGILPTAIDFAIAGNYDTEEAADKLTNVMTSMQLPQATYEQAKQSAQRAADVIAYAANETNSTVAQMTEAYKYAAPSAAALGVSIEQLAAMFVVMARSGIKGSEAGVAVRAMFTRMVRPTKGAQEALARYNIDLADYLEKPQEISSKDIATALAFSGLDISEVWEEIDEILASGERTADKVRKITETVMRHVGDASTMSAESISSIVSEALFGFGEELDIERLIEDMQAAGIAVADFFRIFDVRQGARTLALFSDDVTAVVQGILKMSEGFTEALKNTRMQGIVGSVARMSAALTGLALAAADSGVLDTATNAISRFAESVTNLAKVNLEILEMATYGVMAVAALAPLGFALTGLTAAAALAVNPVAWIAAGLGYLAYLNFDSIIAYMREFGQAVNENMGPRTENAIGRMRELLGQLFSAHDLDAAGAGGRHGNWLAQFVENEIVAFERMLEEDRRLIAAVTDYVTKSFDGLKRGWALVTPFWDDLVTTVDTGVTKYISASVDGISRAATEIRAEAVELYNTGVDMVQSLWDGAVVKFNEFIAWVKQIPSMVLSAIGSIDLSGIISFPSVASIRDRISSAFGGGGSSSSGSGDSGIAGARAGGGPVDRGLTYLVGEKGPELFTPDRSGNIVPNHKLGGAAGATVVFNNQFHLSGKATREDASELARILERQLNRSVDIAVGTIKPWGDECW